METKKLIEKANEILLKGEPANISYDTYAGYSGYKPQYVIAAMNEAFGVGNWGFEELSMEMTETLALAKVQVWLKDIEAKPTAHGQSRVTKGDVGDARKGAQTDAIKKGLSYFGIGERAYFGLLPTPQNAKATHQVAHTATFKQETSNGTTEKFCGRCGTKALKVSAQGNTYCKNAYDVNGKKVPGHIVKDKKVESVQIMSEEEEFLASLPEHE